MKKVSLRSCAQYMATAGAFALMAISVLSPMTASAASAAPTKCAAGDVKCVITAGDQLITERQNALNTLSSKISTHLSAHRITSDQANALQADVSTNRTGLANLKTRLDAETTMSAARTDVMNIFLQFRIYAVVLPRDYRTIEMDVEINAKAIMKGVASTVEKAIDSAPASKQAQLKSLFSDYQAQVAAAEAQLDSAQKDFPALTPENFNQNKASYEATLQALNNALKAARADLHRAAKDLHQMAHILGIKA